MKKKSDTRRYTAKRIDPVRRKDKDLTDDSRIDSMTEEELEAVAAEEGEFDWKNAEVGFPLPKQQLTVRFDQDVINWFKAQGGGYQTRMNAVLRSYVEAHRRSL